MSVKLFARESHIFSTGVDNPAYVNAYIDVDASQGMDAAGSVASKAYCDLLVREGALILIRNGDEIILNLEDVTLDVMRPEAIQRLSNAGLPLLVGDPGMKESAMAGLLDGSMVITDDDLITVPFHTELLDRPDFCELIRKSAHIAYNLLPK